VLAAALILDAWLGEPRWLWSRLPHPVVVMGRAIGALDRRWNAGRARRAKGALMLALVAGGAAASGWALGRLPLGPAWEVLAAAILLAQRSLAQHVGAVADGLGRDLGAGRRAVAMIVGRDTDAMDAAAVARAGIESAAENLSDGVIAPAFWFAVGGLPCMLAYKAINTADSTVGYLTPRHRAFGWAAARADDAANWIPARLTALLILLACAPRRLRALWPQVAREARLHRSPNAGWPEAALAPVLGVALSGPRAYGGRMRDYAWVNPAGRRDAGPGDVRAAVAALWRTWTLSLGLALVMASLARLG
jgi:adenosylcobinamide-phosphate synthase